MVDLSLKLNGGACSQPGDITHFLTLKESANVFPVVLGSVNYLVNWFLSSLSFGSFIYIFFPQRNIGSVRFLEQARKLAIIQRLKTSNPFCGFILFHYNMDFRLV